MSGKHVVESLVDNHFRLTPQCVTRMYLGEDQIRQPLCLDNTTLPDIQVSTVLVIQPRQTSSNPSIEVA